MIFISFILCRRVSKAVTIDCVSCRVDMTLNLVASQLWNVARVTGWFECGWTTESD